MSFSMGCDLPEDCVNGEDADLLAFLDRSNIGYEMISSNECL